MTVAAETCLFLEHTLEYEPKDFVAKGLKLFSLLYLKTSVLEIPERVYEDDAVERFVAEEDYNEIKSAVEQVLGVKDSYLETFHPDMSLSDSPVAAFVSENLADVYQELKDFVSGYQLADTDIMNDALAVCLDAFAGHWGQKLLNAMRALHAARYSDDFNAEEMDYELLKPDRNSFLDYLRDDDDELNDLI